MSKGIDFYELHAKRRYGLPDNWVISRWDASQDSFMQITGAVCVERFSRCKRKGLLNWSKRDRSTEVTVSIASTDHAAFLIAWEAETGKCHVCQGDGQEWAGWSKAEGTRYRECRRCNATGVAPAKAEA